MSAVSPLQPISPEALPNYEQEDHAPWIMRKLVGSMIGRVAVSSLETFKATGTNIICLSAWGDSSPLFLPCIMWRDIIIHSVIAATGGTAAIAAPAMGPIMDTVVSTIGDSIAVEMGMRVGYDVGIKVADDLIFDKTIKKVIPVHSSRLETTGTKTMTITAKYKHTRVDAALGYFRSSVHNGDPEAGLFSTVKDYLSVEKGWWNPVLFASGRRPCIPRSMQPDVVFCHGPFLQADYRVAQTLLTESASVISFADAVSPPPTPPNATPAPPTSPPAPGGSEVVSNKHSINDYLKTGQDKLTDLVHMGTALGNSVIARSRTPSPQPPPPVELAPEILPPASATTPAVVPPPIVITPPRRMVILLVSIAPHRKLWTTSARPSESVIQYTLLNGCPAIVLPVKQGCPLMAWDTLTLESLWDPKQVGSVEGSKFDGVVDCLFEYVGFCADWDRFEFPEELEVEEATGETKEKKSKQETAERLTRNAIALLVAAAVRSKDSKEAKKHINADRAGIVMLRLP